MDNSLRQLFLAAGERGRNGKRGEQPVGHAAAEPGIDRGPVAEPRRQVAPLAAVLQNVRKHAFEAGLRNLHVPPLKRKTGVDFHAMLRRDLFHDRAPIDFYLIVDRHLSVNPSKIPA